MSAQSSNEKSLKLSNLFLRDDDIESFQENSRNEQALVNASDQLSPE